jgi:hypothetical protein
MFKRPLQTFGGLAMFFAGYLGADLENIWASIAAVLVVSLVGWHLLDLSMDRER